MKVSINLAQQYSNVDLKGIDSAEMLKRIGSQLGAVEEVIYWAPKYEGVVVVKVMDCVKHPNADKLHVCKIDDGGATKNVERDAKGYVQVVCGAPNVKKDMFVAWIPPRSTVPSTKGTDDEFVLEARELRGVVSNGMLASAQELAINDDHSGLLEITKEDCGKDPIQGEPFAKYFGLDDVVIDCENKMFTHRPDCFGNLGVARELAGINGLIFKSPDWYQKIVEVDQKSSLAFESKNEIKDLVPRFMAQVVEGVVIKSSSRQMQVDLARTGYRSLNNIVDYTNYYMHLTAQPTHAFDYDKIKALSSKAPTIFPREAKDGEELKLLNGKTIKLTSQDIVIATDKKAVALAGIMGGAETEVDENTKNIIIECATFDMYAVRRSSMRHGIFSDAVSRFNKGQSPHQNDKVLAKIVHEITSSTGAKAGKVVDISAQNNVKPPVAVNVGFINIRLGKEFSAEEIKDLLERTEFNVKVDGNQITIESPFWRRDINLAEDVVEEVGRIYGYDNLPAQLPVRKSSVVSSNDFLTFKRQLAHALKSFGANEILTYSFVHGDLLKATGQNMDDAYQIRNAISPDLQYYRLSITPSLLNHVHANIKAGFDEFAVFEIGTIHNKKYSLNDEKVPVEKNTLAFVYTANDKQAKDKTGAAYYVAQHYLNELLNTFNVDFEFKSIDDIEIGSVFDKARSAVIIEKSTKEIIGVIGEYTVDAKNKLKLPKFCAGFEVFTDLIFKNTKSNVYEIQSRYPSSEQDMTLAVGFDVPFSAILNAVDDALAVEQKTRGYGVKVEPLDIYSDNSSEKRCTLRFTISHQEKTLRTEELNELMDRIAQYLEQSQGYKRI